MSENRTALLEKMGGVEMLRTCEQCGCCSSACPITGRDNFNVRRIVRYVELDMAEDMANTPIPWRCTTCGRCETVCPNGIGILDIIRPLRSMGPARFVPEETPPCVAACPAGIDIPGYVRLIGQGKPQEAYKLILEKVPFPGILGRVCMHPCETKCRRGEVNQPVSICALKRYAAEKSDGSFRSAADVKESTGHKVAVVGSGPAGLAVAFYLRKKGHDVTMFEAREKPGGMMRYGIPSYRLPEEVLEKEIGQILSLGIRLDTGKRLGKDFTLEQLKNDGYQAVFIGTGLPESRKIALEGADSADVLWGVDFLGDVSAGKQFRLKDKVLVVGGGNVAVDVALTALRTGAKEVTMACLESRKEMPASPWEIEQALEEGVNLMPSWGPHRIIREDGSVKAVELVTCRCVFDEKGNFCPAFGETKETVEADQVILAIGQSAELSFLASCGGVKSEKGLIVIDPKTYETAVPGVFAGGDATRGPGAIIDAVAAGRKAAVAIDRYLGGDGMIEEVLALRPDTGSYDGKREKGFADLCRESAPRLPLEERRQTFREVDLCFSDEQAVNEAKRCLQCDLEVRLAKAMRS